ncbi:MAG: LuxR C-terminal-related transcriptional regulator [Umezawaea sp.]
MVDEIRGRLGASRLVTLTGVGGTGKTRLAYEVGDRIRADYSQGVYMVELLPFRDIPKAQQSEVLYRAVADALGIRDQSQRDPVKQVLEHLAQGDDMLLIIDNAEHMRHSTASLAVTVLMKTSRLRMMITSRELLNVGGEAIVAVPPLSLPPNAELPPRLDYEAVTLLLDRAKEKAPGWEITDQNWPSVVTLLRRCAGVPLAIELAVGRLRGGMGVEFITQRLDEMFRLFTNDDLTVQSNHESLQSVMDWSHDLCTPAEQRLWWRLSVFSNGWTLPAAEQVCCSAEIPRGDIVDVLAGLVDKSIVQVTADRSRYELLEPVQQYGWAHLEEAGEDREIRRRHRDWVASMLAASTTGWRGPHEIDVMRAVRRELDNVRSAISWTARVEPDSPISLVMPIDFVRMKLPFFDGLQATSRTLLRVVIDAAPAEPSLLRASAIAIGAWVALCQGDRDTAGEILREALDMAAGLPDSPTLPLLRMVEGSQRLMSLALPDSLPLLREARDLFREAGASEDAVTASMMLALGYALVGTDEHEAMSYVVEHLELTQSDRAPWMISWAQIAAALAHQRHGRYEQAVEYNRTALRDQQAMGDRWGTLWCVEIQAWLAADATVCADSADVVPELARHAARLLGIASRLQEMTRVRIAGLAPFLRQREHAISLVRAVLSEKQFDAAFERGMASRSYDHAIAIALDDPYEEESTSDAGRRVASLLTPAQLRVAKLVAQGKTTKAVATMLTVTERTVSSHLEDIYRRLGISRRGELAAWFYDHE